jgi:glutathione synthase/RimK-type ligase-like ATP-grasp enzyme
MMSAPPIDIALVTYRGAPGLDPDDEPLARTLAARGIACAPVPWDTPGFDWSKPRIALLRSPWDYHHRRDEFLAWARATAARTKLLNPLAVVEWNTHKGYLVELAARGAPVVPTVLVKAGAPCDLPEVLAERGWARAVLKPAVSADSFATMRVEAADHGPGVAHLARYGAEHDMMIQPFIESVETTGERCLVFIAGELSHAVRKNSLFLGGRHVGPEGVAVQPAPDEAAVARQVLALAGGDHLLYARVDLARHATGAPILLELELVEPTLFLLECKGAAEKLADALATRLSSSPEPARPQGDFDAR